MKKFFSIGIISLLCCSCATILNHSTTRINIITDTPAKIEIDTNTFATKQNQMTLIVPRQEGPLKLTVFNDSISKNITINSKNSFAYWLNIPYNYGIGLLAERDNPKRYGYPKNVYVYLNESENDYLDYLPFDQQFKNNFKITPFRLLMSHPGVELSYERYFSPHFSTQLSLAALYNLYSSVDAQYVGSGYQIALEEKYFFKESINRPYVSIETGYFNIINANYYEMEVILKDTVISDYNGTKKIFYITPKFGAQMTVTKRFIVDAYVGLGVKYEERYYKNTLSPYDKWGEIFWMVKVPFNVKIGWRF